jgi:protocatechuate 3,4-dioxygenase alpha subunit
VPTDLQGGFMFHTVRPGAVPDAQGQPQAPHAVVMIGMRGLLKFLMTRFYFPGSELAADSLLSSIEPTRRETLIGKNTSATHMNWHIKVQGEGETVFFDY